MITGAISDSEWKILKLLWRRAPQTLPEILDSLKDSGWSNTTIQTFLARLVKKGAVKTERQGKGYLYTPLVSEEECQRSEAKAFLERVFDGSIEKLAASFSKGILSEKELEALEQMIDPKN